jgi:hypothetical protein
VTLGSSDLLGCFLAGVVGTQLDLDVAHTFQRHFGSLTRCVFCFVSFAVCNSSVLTLVASCGGESGVADAGADAGAFSNPCALLTPT